MGTFTRSTPDVADEIEIFEGAENKITMEQTQSKEFHCIYYLHYYPFDSQKCGVSLQLEQFAHRSVKLTPSEIKMLAQIEMTQYTIESWTLLKGLLLSVSEDIKYFIVRW